MNSNILTFILGVLGSLLIWFLTTILLTPKIKVCKQISKKIQKDGSPKYRIKIINKSYLRDAYGMVIYFRILYKGTCLTISGPDIPVLYSKKHAPIKWGHERFIPINVLGIRESKIEGLNDSELLKKYKNHTLTIEDFYNDKFNFEVVFVANDKFTNAGKYVTSISYNAEQLKTAIVEGDFEDGKDYIKPSPHAIIEE